MDIYRLVSTSDKRVVESPFCLCGARVGAFYLREAAIRVARALREDVRVKTVYGCYDQPDGSFLIGLASARPGKFRQKISLRKVSGKPDPSVEMWKSVTIGRVTGPLDAFARDCLQPQIDRFQRLNDRYSPVPYSLRRGDPSADPDAVRHRALALDLLKVLAGEWVRHK